MFNTNKMIVCHNVEGVPSFTPQDPHLEEYNRDSLVCPGAPKIGFIEYFEGPSVMDDEQYDLLSSAEDPYIDGEDDDNTRALFGLYPEASFPLATPLHIVDHTCGDSDRDTLVCPGAPKLPFIEEFERLSIITNDTLVYFGISQPSPFPSLDDRQYTDGDNENAGALFGLYPEPPSPTILYPGVPKMGFIETFEGSSIVDDRLLAHYSLCGLSPPPVEDDDTEDENNSSYRHLFGLYKEQSLTLATPYRRVGHVRRGSDEYSCGSSTTSSTIPTPPISEFIPQEESESMEKEVEITSDLVIVGEHAVISHEEPL
jgi:hypothetical protein